MKSLKRAFSEVAYKCICNDATLSWLIFQSKPIDALGQDQPRLNSLPVALYWPPGRVDLYKEKRLIGIILLKWNCIGQCRSKGVTKINRSNKFHQNSLYSINVLKTICQPEHTKLVCLQNLSILRGKTWLLKMRVIWINFVKIKVFFKYRLLELFI